jgi:dinuclear metal center YbgI/SA1388 family protein
MGLDQSKTVGEVIRYLDELAPPGTAENWDNVGLLLGDPKQTVTGAVLSIDLTFEAVELAVQKNYSLILNHHPCIFPKQKGINKVIAGSPLYEALKRGIAVAAYHTNFDQCSLEVIQFISEGLGVVPQGRLIEKSDDLLMKLVAFVPESHLEGVRTALCEAGAGQIGNYDYCTFGAPGEGTFRGGRMTHPFLGEPGQLEKVKEVRLETIFPVGLQDIVSRALFKAHPYEEIAYDFYPIKQSPSGKGVVKGLGYGFWGDFPSPRPFSDVAKDVKSLFNIHGFWITDPAPSFVSRVGFVAGKGASFVEAASSVKCDLFITGEAGYHTALSGLRRGVSVMELGHRESERFFIETMKKWLSHFNIGFVETQMPTQKIWQEVSE